LKKRAIVSACLLGEYCRYDGKTKEDALVLEHLQGYEVIPFCPEAPLFGTPRERINVVEKKGTKHIITDKSEIDVTQKLEDEIEEFINKHPEVDLIILKSKSPSCGLGTTPILDEKREIVGYGNGIAADLFLKHYKSSKIIDERL